MKNHVGLALVLLLAAAALAGCGKSTKPSSPAGAIGSVSGGGSGSGGGGATVVDGVQINDAMAANPTVVDDGLTLSPAPMVMPEAPLGMGWYRPFRWWRSIDSTTRVVDIKYGDPDASNKPTTAVASITRHLYGTFNIVRADSAMTAAAVHVVRKPLEDVWERKLAFKRDTMGTRPGWHIVGTSGVLVTSVKATTEIKSLRIQSGARDTLITDPLQLHRLPHVLCFRGFAPTHLTVTTGRPDDIVVLYRSEERRRFTNNGDGTYSLDFLAADFGGLEHFGVNALSNGTLMDDKAPYDSQAWLLPFAVHELDADIDRR
jgi:hypothetical protein